MHDACKQGMYNVVESLVRKGAYVGVTDVEGYTPLQVLFPSMSKICAICKCK